MSSWPNKIYVATTNLGVYYTENFESPEIQPTWIPINAGLPSLDVKEFWVDPFYPDSRQYLILQSNASIYTRINHGGWIKVLSPAMLPVGGSIGGFCCDTMVPGSLYANCGAPSVVSDPDYYYGMHSSDYGLTWQRCSYESNHTIWTYGLGTCRAYDGLVYWFCSIDLGAFASINLSHIDWNYIPHATIDPADPLHPFSTWDVVGGGAEHWLTKLMLLPPHDWADAENLQIGLGSFMRGDLMWFNDADPTHSRTVVGGTLYSTRDSWDTIESQSHIDTTSGSIVNICPYNKMEDINQILVGQNASHHYPDQSHAIGAIYGEDATESIGIAGSMTYYEPYTGSIPCTHGGIAENGVQALSSRSGIRTYAVAMPDYVGDQRGEPMAGDRSAWDAVDYAERHSIDLGLTLPIHHVPAPTYPDTFVYSEDGLSWGVIRIPLSALGGTVRQTILTFSGDLSVSNNPYKIYNLFGSSQTIRKVFLTVDGAPTGADLIVDVHQDGATIFENQATRPRIAAGETTGYSEDMSQTLWSENSYLTAHIDQIGSTYAGAYLVVHIVHGAGIFTASSTKSAYISGSIGSSKSAFTQGPTGDIKHAYLRGPDPEKDSVSAYTAGSSAGTSHKDAYLYGVEKPSSHKDAFTQGGYA